MINKQKFGLLLAAITLGLLLVGAGCGGGDPVKQVAALDEEAVYSLPAFVTAKADLKVWVEEEAKKLEAGLQDKKLSDEKKKLMVQEYQTKVSQRTNEVLNALRERAEGAVAVVAREKGALVVLDKKIVVYGVPEITDEVKKVFGDKEKFGEEDKLSLPPEEDTSKAPVGYFDQSVVRSLKVFQAADQEVDNERRRLMEEFRKALEGLEKKPAPTELKAMQDNVRLKLEAFQEQKLAPLIKAVNDSVEEVARTEGLSLVLDKQHVMYGGRNLTNEVVDTFLKKAGALNEEKAPEGAATPKGDK